MRRRAVLTTFAAGTFALAHAPAIAAGPAPVRIGTVPADPYAQPFYGDGSGIFRDAGIAVEIIALANSAAIAAALAGGAIDVGLGSPNTVGAARLRGLPFAFFAPGALYENDASTSMLVVPKTSALQTARDLIGKTVAVDDLRSIPQMGATLWLEANGIDPAGVKFIELPFGAMAAALQAGRVDAATIAEPALSAARPMTRVLMNTNALIGPRWFISGWLSTEAWLAANGALGHRLAQAVAQTSAWANSHQTESAAILERISKLSHDVIAGMTRCHFGTKLDPALLDPILQIAYKKGVLPAAVGGSSLIAAGYAAS